MTAPFFRRFRVPDTAALLKEIAADEAALAAAADDAARLMPHLRMGFDLIPLDREAEAVAHLEAALAICRKLGDSAHEIETLLYLGTARQYLGEREQALTLFADALALAQDTGIGEQVHFILYHRGRCHAEMGHISAAKRAFEAALRIRETLDEKRFANAARDALDDLDRL